MGPYTGKSFKSNSFYKPFPIFHLTFGLNGPDKFCDFEFINDFIFVYANKTPYGEKSFKSLPLL